MPETEGMPIQDNEEQKGPHEKKESKIEKHERILQKQLGRRKESVLKMLERRSVNVEKKLKRAQDGHYKIAISDMGGVMALIKTPFDANIRMLEENTQYWLESFPQWQGSFKGVIDKYKEYRDAILDFEKRINALDDSNMHEITDLLTQLSSKMNEAKEVIGSLTWEAETK